MLSSPGRDKLLARRIRHDLRGRAVANDLALVEHKQTAAHAHDLCQVVLHQHGGDARRIDGDNDIDQLLASL